MITEDQLIEAKFKAEVWSRRNETSNKVIWDSLDAALSGMIRQARDNRAYEAYAFLNDFREKLMTELPAKFRIEYDAMLTASNSRGR